MYAMGYDFETTGLPLFDQPSDDTRQPHIVQLGAKLIDLGTRQTVHALDLIIRPTNWTIPAEVSAIHGITQEYAELVGIDEVQAVRMLMQLWDVASFRIAHNESFDCRIARIALKRFPEIGVDPDQWKAGAAVCTAKLAEPIMKMAPTEKMVKAGRNYAKKPKLTEAYKHFTGKELNGAHQAMVDVDGCLEVYFAIQGDQLPDGLNDAPRAAAEPVTEKSASRAAAPDIGGF